MDEFFWLPSVPDWQEKLSQLAMTEASQRWPILQSLANSRIGFAETIRLDKVCQRFFDHFPPPDLTTRPVRLAIFSSSTSEHLCPGLRVGALRHGLWLSTYTPPYGQYLQELMNPDSGLHAFKPDAILFAFDPVHLFGLVTSAASASEAEEALNGACRKLDDLWCKCKELFGCDIYQQTLLPQTHPLMGNNEHRLPGSLHQLCRRMNERLRHLADAAHVHLLAIDDQAAMHGLHRWRDPVYWYKAKQEITPLATPLYGELMGRLLAAVQGRSSKCLVLDLDNTLWGGVIGDDGLEGIKIGQGSPLGEAYLAVQHYTLELARRGIILAVCSKNDEDIALSAFEKHPDMLLKRSDIACFLANWEDKPYNLRRIAENLNIGLDSMVFVDDNPFERNIVRRELPMVSVPELPEDPALYVQAIAAAGYFEAIAMTEEDRLRNQQYRANIQRQNLQTSITDMPSYLRSLKMEIYAAPFDVIGLPRILQLINKTNQFNLTTKRYSEAEIRLLMNNPQAFTLQLRLTDQFGDNGMIGVVIGVADGKGDIVLDTWLMSCRVLGRGVEQVTLNLIIEQALAMKAQRLIGRYISTGKNGIVSDHYQKLGFSQVQDAEGGAQWMLPLNQIGTYDHYIAIKRVAS